MAKRGYRGKHPFNDMNVAEGHGDLHKAANSNKLTDEYNKTGAKNKYDYIKSHDGFYPQGSLTISGTIDLVTASEISMSAYDGTTLYMKGKSGATVTATGLFQANTTAAKASEGIRDIINVKLAGKVTASVAGGIVTATQQEPGPDGNSEVILAAGTVVEIVTFNGTGANSSGSLFYTGG